MTVQDILDWFASFVGITIVTALVVLVAMYFGRNYITHGGRRILNWISPLGVDAWTWLSRRPWHGLALGNPLQWSDRGPGFWFPVTVMAVIWILGIYLFAGVSPSFREMLKVAALISAFFVAFPLFPGAVDSLIQRPNRHRPTPAEVGKLTDSEITTRDYPPSRVGFFVYPEPGREYRTERGRRPVRGIMATDHKMYLGEQDNPLTPKHAEYWENVPTPPEYEDSHPLPFPGNKSTWRWLIYSPLSLLWWGWKRYVYWLTGAAFTGFYPFQMPRVVPMERFVMRVIDGIPRVDRIEDYSNHYRVEQFMFPLLIGNIDTLDKIPFKVLLNVVARVYNSYLTAYRTDDRWSSRLISSITDPLGSYARSTRLGAFWVAKSMVAARKVAEVVLKMGKMIDGPNPTYDPRSTCGYGIIMDSVEVIDISPMSDSDIEAFGEEARAEVEKLAMFQRAKGKAASITEAGAAMATIDKALAENPAALAALSVQGQVTIGETAGTKGNLVLMTGPVSSGDQTQAAVLQYLRRLEQQDRR